MTACRREDSAEHVLSSDGRAFPGVVLEIRDEDGKPVPAGTEGEICHGGPGLMLGYWRRPGAHRGGDRRARHLPVR